MVHHTIFIYVSYFTTMKSRFPFSITLVFLWILGLASQLQAHSVWIEDTPEGRLILRFGEIGDDYEKSPGHLDDLRFPLSWMRKADDKTAAIALQKNSDHYLLLNAASKEGACAETDYPVLAAKDKPGRKPFFYARWHVIGEPVPGPSMVLDLVPTSTPGTVRLYLRGKPQPGAKIVVHTPKGKDQEITTDGEGNAHFELAQSGLYILTCAHQRETIAGFAAGLSYEMVSHNCSLAWRQP